jgi:hypothetical protein
MKTHAAELAAAMATLPGTVTPETARALQATENTWRRIDAKWGLWTARQVAEMLTGEPNIAYASRLRATGQIIGIRRKSRIVYPGFQFDSQANRVKPVIPALIRLGRDVNYDSEAIVLSLAGPSTYWHDETPLNHLDEEDFLLTLHDSWTVEW